MTALDNTSREQIARNVLALKQSATGNSAIVWILADTSLTRLFGRVIVFDGSALTEDGSYSDLIEEDGLLKELVSG